MKACQPFAANGFTAALAKKLKADLVAGDPVFKAGENEIRICWLDALR